MINIIIVIIAMSRDDARDGDDDGVDDDYGGDVDGVW